MIYHVATRDWIPLDQKLHKHGGPWLFSQLANWDAFPSRPSIIHRVRWQQLVPRCMIQPPCHQNGDVCPSRTWMYLVHPGYRQISEAHIPSLQRLSTLQESNMAMVS